MSGTGRRWEERGRGRGEGGSSLHSVRNAKQWGCNKENEEKYKQSFLSHRSLFRCRPARVKNSAFRQLGLGFDREEEEDGTTLRLPSGKPFLQERGGALDEGWGGGGVGEWRRKRTTLG